MLRMVPLRSFFYKGAARSGPFYRFGRISPCVGSAACLVREGAQMQRPAMPGEILEPGTGKAAEGGEGAFCKVFRDTVLCVTRGPEAGERL